MKTCPSSLWRVGRAASPLNFAELDPLDATMRNAGNRFDVLGGSVLYAASSPEGAFAETLGRLRPTAKMLALPVEADEHLMAVGSIAADWRERRQLTKLSVLDPLPFLDADATETHTYLTSELAQTLESHGVDTLNISDVRGRNRLLTRAISQWAYAATDAEGALRFGGIRYTSKIGDWECWAIFGGSIVKSLQAKAIDRSDPALIEIARLFDLTIH